MRKYILYVCCCLLFVSCQQSTTHISELSGGTLRLAMTDITFDNYIFPPTISDDYEKALASIFYEGLFRINPFTLSVENALCTTWEVDNSGLVYTLYLDSTAMFAKDACLGKKEYRPLTAYDVKYTFHLLANPQYSMINFTNTVYHIKGAKEYFSMTDEGRDTSRIEGISVVDDYTLKITLDKPSPRFIQNLAHPSAAIVPPEAVQQYGDTSTVGIGAFLFCPSESAFVFTKNPYYYRFDAKKYRLPYLDSVIIMKVPNLETSVDLFLDEKLDAILFVPATKISNVIAQIPSSIPYEITESNIINLKGEGKTYNIIRSEVKGLYTNRMNILDLSQVYKKK